MFIVSTVGKLAHAFKQELTLVLRELSEKPQQFVFIGTFYMRRFFVVIEHFCILRHTHIYRCNLLLCNHIKKSKNPST